jgi:melibiase-like protein
MNTVGTMFEHTLLQGKLQIEFFLRSSERDMKPVNLDVNTNGDIIHIKAYYELFEENIFIKKNNDSIVCERAIKNISKKKESLKEAGAVLKGISFDQNSSDDFFYHVENPRIYSKMTIPIDTIRTADMVDDSEFDVVAGNQWIDSYDVCERIGFSPYQPFPAILLSNYKTSKGVIHGSLSQKVFYHNYLVNHEGGAIKMDILSSFKAIDARELKSGEILEDKWYIGITDQADDLEQVFANYLAVLKQHLPPLFGSTNINRHSLVWGSWNDGISRDIDEGRLIQQADFLSKNLPTVEWMQIDDGYAEYAGKLNIAHGLGAPYEENGGTDLKKFPENLKGFTDKVKEKGIKPALWIGGHVPSDSPLGQSGLDWFFDYTIRPCVKNSSKKCSYLDVSKPEVREYMCKALDFLLTESGFLGMKHDFWSYAYEDSRICLENSDKSGYEWRSWWLEEVRKRLPDYGYLQTGCDIVMGNPFLAEKFTNYRYGIDIGSGNWNHIVTNFLWGTACFALHVGDLFVPNSDSVGLLPGLSEDEALFCINYCLISRSMVEVAGWLYQEPDHPRMKWLKKALCCPNNGQDVFFAGYDYRKESKGPEVWYLKTPHFSLLQENECLPLRTFAVFNLEDSEHDTTFKISDLDLPAGNWTITNVWTLETVVAVDEFTVTLNGRGSALFAINPEKTMQVLDSNIKIEASSKSNNDLELTFAHKGKLELVLNFKPETVLFENKDIKNVINQGFGNWSIELGLDKPGQLILKS